MPTHSAVVHYALEPLAVELREVPVPDVGDDDVLLAVGAVSVCGSDMHQAHNTHSWGVNIPVVLGHEFGGTVAKTGASVRGFRDGDRVVSETAARICGECMQCRTGWYNLCPRGSVSATGWTAPWRSTCACRRAVCTAFRTPCRSTSRASPNPMPSRIRRCASTRRFVPAIRWWCSVPDRSVCCVRGWRRCRGPIR